MNPQFFIKSRKFKVVFDAVQIFFPLSISLLALLTRWLIKWQEQEKIQIQKVKY